MAYTPNNWQTGDTITAAKLNNMEQGIASAGGMVVPTFADTGGAQFSCDMTFASVNAAVKAGKCCYAFLDTTTVLTLSEYYEDDTVTFSNFTVGGGVFKFSLSYDTTGITYDEQMYPEE